MLRRHGGGEGESELGTEVKEYEISRVSQCNAFLSRKLLLSVMFTYTDAKDDA